MTNGTTNLSERELQDFQIVSDFMELISGAEGRWEALYNKVGKCNEKEGDLKHEIENFRLDVFKGFELYKEFHKLRKYRRVLKNQQEMLKPLFEWVKTNKNMLISLYKVKTEMAKQKELHENWVYKPRSKTAFILEEEIS
jgi:hypothetical protein